jgi:PAS domain S-box-containing protein
MTDAAGAVVAANPAYCRLVGLPRGEVEGRPMADAYAAARRPTILSDYARRFAARAVESQYEAEVELWDGRRRWFELANAHLDTPGEPPLLLSVFRDVTDRKRHEAALREREALLQGVIANIPCRVFWKDRDSVFLGCNDLFARDHGLPDPGAVVGRSDFDLGTPAEQAEGFRARDRRVVEAGEPDTAVEELLTLPGGASVTLLTSKVPLRNGAGEVVGVLGVYQDITARKRLEEQFRQAQKLEAVGRLAGGVAHDFNNLLTVINGYSDVLLAALPGGDAARPMVEEVRRAGERAAGLTRQLLAFGRKQLLRHKVLDLNAVVGASAEALRRLVGGGVELAVRPGAGLPPVKADPGQLEQVLVNLAANARDAMPAGGTLTVETRAVTLGGGRADDGSEVLPGAYVLLAVSDTGAGMTGEVKAHVFEPFFTTKGQGKGTGLGLATVYGIVKQSGGHAEVETAPGRGASFRVYLPAVGPAGQAARAADALPRGTETVLVAEREEGARRLAALSLRHLGYTVLPAPDADGAAALAGECPRVDLLLVDAEMPGAEGRGLVERLRADRPGLRVIYVTGGAEGDPARHGGGDRGADLLRKPFTPAELARKVREVLDRKE